MPCLRNCPVWVAGQVGADGRCEDNCVSSDRFDSWALKPIVFIAACVSLLTASIDSIWNCVLPVPASTHMQSFVRFGWPAVDPLCVSSDRKRGHQQDRDDCYDFCVYYKYFIIRTYYSWQSCLLPFRTNHLEGTTCVSSVATSAFLQWSGNSSDLHSIVRVSLPCLRNCPVWVAGQVGADGRCEDNCVSSDRFDSWALKPSVFIAACVSLLTASIDSIWNCVLPVAASTHMQSFVRFGWPAVDPLCVSSDRKRGRPQDRDDCYDFCVYYKYFFIRTYYSWQSCLLPFRTNHLECTTCVSSVATSAFLQWIVKFVWPAFDRSCVSSDRKRRDAQDRDDCCEWCFFQIF